VKIVIDARESGGSTGRYVNKLIEYLHKLRPEHEITVLAKPDRIKVLRELAPTFEVIESDFKEFTFAEQFGFARQLYSLKPNLVHFGATHQPILYFGKTITTVHDLTTARFYNPAKNWFVFKLKQWVYRVVIWIVAHKSKTILTPSEYVRQDLAHYTRLNRSKITVTHEAADKIVAAAEPIKELDGKQFLLYVGRAQPHKNLRRLIDAFQELKWVYPDLKLVLAGKKDASYQRLERYVKVKKVGEVMFADFVPEQQLRWLYENAAVYVFPSLSEGFGLPPLEAMQHGLPVVSSNATCLPEINRDAALYFDPKSTKALVEQLKLVLDNPKVGKDLAKKGRELVGQYSWGKMAQETLEAYRKILD